MAKGQQKNVNDYSIHRHPDYASTIHGQTDRQTFDRESILEYIEAMTSELSVMAAEQDQDFLAYLLNLAVFEAQAAKTRTIWSAHQPRK
ncbi:MULTISPECIES: hypothetical protein [Rhodomicrobium]|uniref:hypothetical protein n=1 Tax=Rhodomicrobium TaxID=1068 RepID=UPI000F749C4F|nr:MULTISPECIES: hypothetical protein [Rhodomicrobium]